MVVHPLCLSLIVSWEGVIVTTKASAVTYQEYHCLIDPLFLHQILFQIFVFLRDQSTLAQSFHVLHPFMDIRQPFRVNGLLFLLCVRLPVRRNWKRHIFGPDLGGRGGRCGPSDPYRPEFRWVKSLKEHTVPRLLRYLGLRNVTALSCANDCGLHGRDGQ